MGGFPTVMVIGVLALIAAGIFLSALAARRRRETLAEWANQHGLEFTTERNYDFDDRFGAFKFLHTGSERYAFNLLRGDWRGRRMLGFDYHYQTTSTDSKGHRHTHHHYFSCAILFSSVPLMPLSIRAESIWDKVTEFFGWDDIDFESAEFSRRFHVTSPDRRWAYHVLHPRAMQMLLDRPKFTLQFDGDCVVAHRGHTFSPEEFEQAASLIDELLDALPEYLVAQQSGNK